MVYSVRAMTKEDIAQVNEIDREAFPTQWPPPDYQRELNNRLAHYIVVFDGSRSIEVPAVEPRRLATRIKRLFQRNSPVPTAVEPAPSRQQYIVGFAGIWIMADEAHITNIAVRKGYQRRGIGELLLISTIDLAQGLRASIMTLEVRISNQVAQNLYRKYGFGQMGIRHGYYIDNKEDAIIMSTESINSTLFQERLKQLKEGLARKISDL